MKKYIALLQKYIKSPKRIKHCYSTAKHMKKYAHLFGINKKAAFFVGLMHDIGKELTDINIISYTESFIKRNIEPISYLDFKRRYPSLLHGVGSAEIIIRELDIKNRHIISAIMHHTTGGRNLSKLAKYMFMFDYCEPSRKQNGSKKVFKILTGEKDFNKAYFETYHHLLGLLLEREKLICRESVDGYNDALRKFLL